MLDKLFKSVRYTVIYWFNLLGIKVCLIGKKQPTFELTLLGEPGVDWKVPLALLNKKSVCYCAEVGGQ